MGPRLRRTATFEEKEAFNKAFKDPRYGRRTKVELGGLGVLLRRSKLGRKPFPGTSLYDVSDVIITRYESEFTRFHEERLLPLATMSRWPKSWIDTEIDGHKKSVSRSGTINGWYLPMTILQPDASGMSFKEINGTFDRLLHSDITSGSPAPGVERYGVRYQRPKSPHLVIKLGTGKGWPTNVPGKSPLNKADVINHITVAQLLIGCGGDYDALHRRVETIANRPICEPVAMSYLRKQGGAGEMAEFDLTSIPELSAFTQNEMPRHRSVIGVFAANNIISQWDGKGYKEWYHIDPGATHRQPEDTLKFITQPAFRDFIWSSMDMKKYDLSVSLEYMEGAHGCYPFSKESKWVNEHITHMKVLLPPLYPGDSAFYSDRVGTIVSGDFKTDKDGSVINRVRMGNVMAMANGITLEQAEREYLVYWACMYQSDDCCLGWSKSRYPDLTEEKLLVATESLGFKVGGSDGVTWLQTFYDLKSKQFFRSTNRALDMTFYKERITQDYDITLLGDYARWKGVALHPLGDEAFRTMADIARLIDDGRRRPIGFESQLEKGSLGDFLASAEEVVKSQRFAERLRIKNRNPEFAARLRDLISSYTAGAVLGDDADLDLVEGSKEVLNTVENDDIDVVNRALIELDLSIGDISLSASAESVTRLASRGLDAKNLPGVDVARFHKDLLFERPTASQVKFLKNSINKLYSTK